MDLTNILCVRSDRLGEFLLTLPAVQLLKENYPNARLSVMAQEENAELMKGVSFVDAFLRTPAPGTLRLVRALKKERFDAILIFNPRKELNLASFLAGIPLRAGYNRKCGFLLNKRIEDDKHLYLRHEIEYNIRLASLVCQKVRIPEPEFPWEEKDETLALLKSESIAERLPYVIVHPFSSDPRKEIDFSFWKTLIARIAQQGHTVAIIGLEQEFSRSPFTALISTKCINLCGKLSLRGLGNILKFFCEFYIGVDSGPFHMASLLRIPFAALFTKPENIIRWGSFYPNPRGTAMVYTPDREETCIEKIIALV